MFTNTYVICITVDVSLIERARLMFNKGFRGYCAI